MPDTSIKDRLQALGIYDEYLAVCERYDLPKLVEILQKAGAEEMQTYNELARIGASQNRNLLRMIAERFEGTGAEEASILVSLYAEYLDARVLKCAVYASKGDVRKLEETLDLAMLDWRDVIMMGEYELIGKKLVRIRNFF